MHIGFLGLGNMGGPMARNLLKAGHQVTVFDLSAEAVSGLVGAGAKEATSPAAVAQAGVEAIITMLPAAAHVKQVYLGEDGLLANVQSGVLLIDSSTIDPMSAREVAAA
ncbi:MAG TPA: 3-hydroxyisobutyrate dehydrogenase, partial [Pseudomonas sp.]|nr:3-hydroxyisobutyrate dehydrogenase [Pseudomonas sp.]